MVLNLIYTRAFVYLHYKDSLLWDDHPQYKEVFVDLPSNVAFLATGHDVAFPSLQQYECSRQREARENCVFFCEGKLF